MSLPDEVSTGERLAWALLFAAGACLLSVGIGQEALWADEGFSAALIARPLPELVRLAAADSHGPAYYAALELWSWLFGDSLVALRASSVVGALALAALGPGPVRRLAGPGAAWVFSILLLLSPALACHAQEARMYTWAPFFTTGALLWGLLALRDDRGWDWSRLGLSLVGAMHVHVFGVLAVASLGLVFGGVLVLQRSWAKLRWLVLSFGAAGLCFLPRAWDLYLESRYVVGRGHWVLPLDLAQVVNALVYPLANVRVWDGRLAFAALLVALLASIPGLLGQRWRGPGLRAGVLVPGLAWAGMALLTALISVWILPLYAPRYLFVVGPWLVLPLSVLLGNLRPRWWLGFLGLMAGLLLPAHLYRLRHLTMEPMAEVSASVPIVAGEPFLHLDGVSLSVFSWYYPDHPHYLWMPEGSFTYYNLEAWSEHMVRVDDPTQLLEEQPQVWLVHRRGGHNQPAFERLQDRPGLILGPARSFPVEGQPVVLELRRARAR